MIDILKSDMENTDNPNKVRRNLLRTLGIAAIGFYPLWKIGEKSRDRLKKIEEEAEKNIKTEESKLVSKRELDPGHLKSISNMGYREITLYYGV